MTSFYSQEELSQMGFKSIGKNCKISRKASFYSIQNMSIGDNVRIDDFCILSGNITIGCNIHISAYVALYGAIGIIIGDYCSVSSRTTIYSAMDDFGGDYLVGPCHPEGTTNVTGGVVKIEKYASVGAHVLVFPDLTIGEGVVVGACSMVRKSLDAWGIYYGTPVKRHGERSQKLLSLV